MCKDDWGVWRQDGNQKVIVKPSADKEFIFFLKEVNYSYKIKRKKSPSFSSGSAVLGTGADTVSTSNGQEIFRWISGINFK